MHDLMGSCAEMHTVYPHCCSKVILVCTSSYLTDRLVDKTKSLYIIPTTFMTCDAMSLIIRLRLLIH